MKPCLITLITGMLCLSSLSANEKIDLIKTTVPPVLDGVLDDEAWKNAITFSDYQTFIPDFSKEMPEKTITYATYDEENLYFAFNCYDSEPDKIVGTVRNRDEISSEDFVCINIDTQNDQQSLYAFYVNPYGIQMDSWFSAGKEDPSIDLVGIARVILTRKVM